MRKYYYEMKLEKLRPEKEITDKKLENLSEATEFSKALVSWTDDSSVMDVYMPTTMIIGYIISLWIQIGVFNLGVGSSMLWGLLYSFLSPFALLLFLCIPMIITELIKMPLGTKKKKLDNLISDYENKMLRLEGKNEQ